MESLEDRVRRVSSEPIAIVPYDPAWPDRYEAEKDHLLALLPAGYVHRIEHVGSTAVPGLAAKPIVDILVGVTDVNDARNRVAPLLEAEGYEYFWRPAKGDDGPPFYPWFIKRDGGGARTHHIHVVEMGWVEIWDWVLFRDYLRDHGDVAAGYADLKRRLAAAFSGDRARYTAEKTAFVGQVLDCARRGQGAVG